MMTKLWMTPVLGALALAGGSAPAFAQNIETTGSRALGMGGAFVAVANDSSAAWWNPSGLAAGPFLDIALGRAVTRTADDIPASRERAGWFALGTPPFGFSYHRFRVSSVDSASPTATAAGSREEGRTEFPVRSLSAGQLGFTLLRSLLSDVHVGTTLKYVRGTFRTAAGDGTAAASDLLDRAEDLEGGETEGRFDLDVGIMALAGPLRVGAVFRNALEPEFRAGPSGEAGEAVVRLPRQFRVGVAYDAERAGSVPLTIALDVDLRRYTSGLGERRVVAIGAEHWLLTRRVGVRGGLRFNTVGSEEGAATGGVSVAVRPGLYVDGHIVGGGSADERGWGAAARVSF